MSAICIIESDKITVGSNLMQNNTDLVEWNSNLSNLINGQNMFDGCSALTTFTSNLSSLENGRDMFNSCGQLTTFNSELPNLRHADGMFLGCPLTFDTVEYIWNSLPLLEDSQEHIIDLTIEKLPRALTNVDFTMCFPGNLIEQSRAAVEKPGGSLPGKTVPYFMNDSLDFSYNGWIVRFSSCDENGVTIADGLSPA